MKTRIDAGVSDIASARPLAGGKSDQVRIVFENAPRYLRGKQVDIRIRTETVKWMASKIQWTRMLDIGCGDGTISLPLLTDGASMTLLDLSASMVALVRSKVPARLAGNVEIRNENFMEAAFDPESLDLVVTVGVMAHVDSPDAFISKIVSLLRPGGSLIIEFTDCRHFVGCIGRGLGWLKELIAPPQYRTNLLSFSDVSPILTKHGLKMVSTFRYATVPIPGIERVVASETLHKAVDVVFGKGVRNRNAWLGNEYICWLRRE